MQTKLNRAKTIIGWEEWCSFPALGLPAIKAKIDTGAKTSALHAYDITPFTKDGQSHVRFMINPLPKCKKLILQCESPLIEKRTITSSNGEREARYVIQTEFCMNNKTFQAEMTLTSRHKMTFRMLLGRDALRRGKFIVDPSKSYLLGKITDAQSLYNAETQ